MNCPSCRAANDDAAAACAACGTALPATPTPLVVSVDLRPGTLFHGRYEVRGPLGRGGMGMVYEALDRSLDETVAIKVLRPDFAQDPRMAERFKSEIRLARRIRHRNVCAIHDYGEDRGLLYISMELIEGRDLKHVLKEKGGLPPDQAYAVAIQLAEGLQAVHEAGIIHRDLKTPNIMVDAQGVARLMDFGIAKRQGDGTLTATGNIVGTPEYMSPEQAQGHKVDFRTDIYALGVVVYEIFTGRVPFRGDTPISTILMHLNDPPPLDGAGAERLPEALKPVLSRMLAKDPADRYATAREVAEALSRARHPSARQVPVSTDALRAPTLTQATVADTAPTAPGPSGRRRARTLQPWLLVVPVAAAAAGVLLQGGLWQRGRPVAEPSPVAPTPPTTVAVAPLPSATPEPPTPLPSARPSRSPAPGPSQRAPVPATPPAAASPSAPPPTPTPAPADGGTGLLQIAAIPWGRVSVDGKEVGTTPLDVIPLGAGAHTVRVRHPAYEVEERRVTIRPDQLEKLVIDFPARGVRKQP
jgi:eukaryotic-like serine/threonine-protein kinase